MDTKFEGKDVDEQGVQPEAERLSPKGVSAMQGVESQPAEDEHEKIEPSIQDEKQPPTYDQPATGDSPKDKDLIDATTHPHIGGNIESEISKEAEPISIKVPAKDNPPLDHEDREGKKPPKPPEGWRPGGPESGG